MAAMQESASNKRCNLDHRGTDIDSVRCPICDQALEDSQHLFVDCWIATELWTMVTRWWGLDNYPKDLSSLIKWGDSVPFQTLEKICFDAVVQKTFWIIWRYRNRLCFDAKRPRKDTLSEEIKILSHTWILHRDRKFISNWFEWIIDDRSKTCLYKNYVITFLSSFLLVLLYIIFAVEKKMMAGK